MGSRWILRVVTVAVLIPAVASFAGDAPGRIAVIVGQASTVRHITTADVRELYLRRRKMWPNGQRALPINLPAGDPTRERFSRSVLGRSSDDLLAYWNARYFEGITPPAVVGTPAAVRAYVNAEPNAIGYVPATDVTPDCRTVLVIE